MKIQLNLELKIPSLRYKCIHNTAAGNTIMYETEAIAIMKSNYKPCTIKTNYVCIHRHLVFLRNYITSLLSNFWSHKYDCST